jgi:anaerobic magnesium-protoporphyrin IX monomethyl ester cyclase
MKTLLTHCWFLSEDPAELRVMKPYPPLGLLYLSAWLDREGEDYSVYDATFHTPGEQISYIKAHQPEIIGIYSTLMTKLNVLRVIRAVKEDHRNGSPKIIIGGPDARAHAEGYLSEGADAVVPGEGEETLTELIRFYTGLSATAISEIKGIVFRDDQGNVVRTAERKLLDPALLPFPARDCADMQRYFSAWKERHGYTSITINTMRGCPYGCNWCSKQVFGNSYRRRDPVDVAGELTEVLEKYNPDRIWFTDDVCTIRKDWLEKFADELDTRRLKIRYECISREDCLDPEVISLLRRSGCIRLWIGAESGSQRVLDLMNRRTDIRRTTEMIQLARSAGISAGTFIMLGYPGERKRDIFLTAEYLKKAMPDEVTVTMAYPIEGTRFFEETKESFAKPFDWRSESERQIAYKRPYSALFYRFAIRYLNNTALCASGSKGSAQFRAWLKASLSKAFLLILN